MRILAISGSLRRDSHNTAILRAAARLLPPGVELELYDGLKQVPAYDEDESERPDSVQQLWDAVERSDAVLISTPEYNSSIPGHLKNALDWLSRPLLESPLRNKPAAVVGASTGMFGAVWAQAETRKVLKAIGARVDETELPVAVAHEILAGGVITDEEIEQGLAEVVGRLARAADERNKALGASN